MDDERKNLLAAGVCLGDIALVAAAFAGSVPSYVADMDVDRLLAGCRDVDAVRAEIERALSEHGDTTVPPRILKNTVERAIAARKFLSAIRCLDMLGEKETYVERYLQEARRKVGEGKIPDCARALVVAANLDLPDGIPAFQYAGPDLHEACTSAPENCVTRMERENAILRALKYLLGSDKVHETASGFPAREREDILGYVALARDPDMPDFLASFEKAHHDLIDVRTHAQTDLAAMMKRVEGAVRGFAGSIGKFSVQGAEQMEALDRLRLTTAGLTRELVGLDELVLDRQFHRLARRLEQLLESQGQLEEMAEAPGIKGGPSGAAFDPLIKLIAEIKEKDIPGQVNAVEERLLSVQVTMLGRTVHSHEHWQYLRELAFKYPASPLVCCVSKINDRWMVVPVWESPVAEVLRNHPAGAGRVGSSST
jgi:hypothetical protein